MGGLDGLGVVLGRWGGGGPWLSGSRKLSLMVVSHCYFSHGGVLRPGGPATCGQCGCHFFSLIVIQFGISCIDLLSKNKNAD